MSASLPPLQTLLAAPPGRRRTVRSLAAIASGVTALLYFGVGIGLLQVTDEVPAKAAAGGLFEFGASAGAAFVLGALLLFALDQRVLWVLGALLQVGVIVMYVVVGPQRTPSYEVWGLLIKGLQVAILAALLYLIARPPVPARGR